MLPKVGRGSSLHEGLGWWKGKSASFPRLATAGRADPCPKANSLTDNQGERF